MGLGGLDRGPERLQRPHPRPGGDAGGRQTRLTPMRRKGLALLGRVRGDVDAEVRLAAGANQRFGPRPSDAIAARGLDEARQGAMARAIILPGMGDNEVRPGPIEAGRNRSSPLRLMGPGSLRLIPAADQAFLAMSPPSTGIVAPVMNDAAGRHRLAVMWATSSGSP